MRFHKTMKFNIKHILPTIMIAGSTVFAPSCCKVERDPSKNQNQPHHNTTYVWGHNNWDAVWPADKVAASADSTLVDIVFLQNDGESFHGSAPSVILKDLNMIIENVSVANRYKIRGKGTLNGVGMSAENAYRDSITLAKMGFKINRVH